MAQSWQVVDHHQTPEGALELRQRGPQDYLITIGGRVLMNSVANESEVKLAHWACAGIRSRVGPSVLIGGLGMGYTLRATLDVMPNDARIVVAELNPIVVAWCSGPIAHLCGDALADPRVEVVVGDVAEVALGGGRLAQEPAKWSRPKTFDAIIYDLYEGPHVGREKGEDPLYGEKALRRTLSVLDSGGTFALWGEDQDPRFEKRLDRMRLKWEKRMSGRGGRRHVIYFIGDVAPATSP
jgi:spermidine synthase